MYSNRLSLQNDPLNATGTTQSLNSFVLRFCCCGHSLSSSETKGFLQSKAFTFGRVLIIMDIARAGGEFVNFP